MLKTKALPSASELWELFEFNPLTGELFHAKARRGVTQGSSAGYRRTNGYVEVAKMLRHRVVYKWVTGEDPGAMLVDHINRCPGDDRFSNLRLADPAESSANTAGCAIEKRKNGRYSVRISKNYKRINLGTFDTEAEARAAYEEASKRLHGEFSSV